MSTLKYKAIVTSSDDIARSNDIVLDIFNISEPRFLGDGNKLARLCVERRNIFAGLGVRAGSPAGQFHRNFHRQKAENFLRVCYSF